MADTMCIRRTMDGVARQNEDVYRIPVLTVNLTFYAAHGILLHKFTGLEGMGNGFPLRM